MPTTMELLKKALDTKNAASWCRDLNVTEASLSQLKKKGHLSPRFAALMAIETGEDAAFWTALAVAEAEPEGPLKTTMLKTLSRHKTTLLRHAKRLLSASLSHYPEGSLVA